MLPEYILLFTVLALALIGLVTCLIRWLWVTLLLTLCLVAVVVFLRPAGPFQISIWAVAAGAYLFCLIVALRLRPKPSIAADRKPDRGIVVDGTNVIYWDDQVARLETLKAVVAELKNRGLHPIVFLDASSRHHLKDKSLTEKGFARALKLPQRQVIVCPAGTEADIFILKRAREDSVPILSNDRFGDRAQQLKGLKIVKGVMANGRPNFDGL